MADRDGEFLVLGGEMGYAKDDDLGIGQIENSKGLIEAREVVAVMKIYRHAEDDILQYTIRGFRGSIQRWEPTIEDRQYVSSMMILKNLVESGLDVHDFKTILQQAALNMTADNLTAPEKDPDALRILHAIDKLVADLGGYDL